MTDLQFQLAYNERKTINNAINNTLIQQNYEEKIRSLTHKAAGQLHQQSQIHAPGNSSLVKASPCNNNSEIVH